LTLEYVLALQQPLSFTGRLEMPPLPTEIRLEGVVFGYEDFQYRTPIKFGGIALDRVTILNVHAGVRGVAGKIAPGFGSMPLGNGWSFPSRVLSYDQTLAAMKALAERVCRIFAGHKETGYPIDLYHALEPDIFRAAEDVSRELELAEPIPKLCALVVA